MVKESQKLSNSNEKNVEEQPKKTPAEVMLELLKARNYPKHVVINLDDFYAVKESCIGKYGSGDRNFRVMHEFAILLYHCMIEPNRPDNLDASNNSILIGRV